MTTILELSAPAPAIRRLRAFGATASVEVADPILADAAATLLRLQLHAVDLAYSRFRPDSELWGLYAAGGAPVRVSALLYRAIDEACRVAAATDGAVDPTVGAAVEAIGYDRDFAAIERDGAPLERPSEPAPGWWRIGLDPVAGSVSVPAGVRVDLGAVGKAFASDLAAARIAEALGCPTLVNIGGDIAIAGGAPDGGWRVGIALDSSTPPERATTVIAAYDGGVASSSTAVRAWRRGGATVHHIVDPRSGAPADPFWRLVTVAAGNCVDANAVSTAAIVWGEEAVDRVRALRMPARFVGRDGSVTTVAGWPS